MIDSLGSMLIWTRSETLWGCRPKRAHLDALLTEATKGMNAPVVAWEAASPQFVAIEQSLDDLAASVGDRKVTALKLTVAETAAPDSPVVEVVFGDRDGTLRAFFVVAFLTLQNNWRTRVKVSDPVARSTAEDKLRDLIGVLRRTQVLGKQTGKILGLSALMQSYILWVLIVAVIPDNSTDDLKLGIAIGVGTAFIFFPHMGADSLLAFRARLSAPAPGTGIWSRAVISPAAANVIGFVALLITAAGLVIDILKG
ncbi:hypothetical protein ACFXPY_26885 [Streptomyces sp. NPDC059153]|uniref:hypothetical protein n=1 Tax=Streptomyces sp. NPDC059153 TaxID=3346743 RepID=UPI00369B7550